MDKIKEVENSLRKKYFVEGDSLMSISQVMEEMNIPGLSIAVIDNFEVVWSKGYGVRDLKSKEKVDKNTIFQAASISKPFAAFGVMKLVQEGKIDLDQDITNYLKTWNLKENNFTEEKKVTFRNLLSHNAGITIHGFPGYNEKGEIPTLNEVLDGESPANTGKIEVDTKPETLHRYSGGGYTIAQKALIDITGKEFEKYMQEDILDPIGLENSFFTNKLLTEKKQENATFGHYNDNSLVRHIYPEIAAAGLWTTAEDLAKFAVEIQKSLKGKSNKVLNTEIMETMMTPVLNGEYSIGFGVSEASKEDILYEHAGGNEGYNCLLSFHKSKGYGFAIMVNNFGLDIVYPISKSLGSVYNWDIYKGDSFKEIITLTKEDKSKFVGRYKDDIDRSLKIYENNGELFFSSFFGDNGRLDAVSKEILLDSDRERKFKLKDNYNGIVINGSKFEKITDDQKLLEDFYPDRDYQGAEKWFIETIGDDDNRFQSYEEYFNNTAYTLIYQEKYDLATFYLKLNTLLYPKSWNAWDSLGEVYFFTKRYLLAIEAMENSLENAPDNKNAKKIIEESKAFLVD